MFSKQIPPEATTIEVLHFDIPECDASIPMADAASRFSVDIGADLTTLDVWTNPDAVIAHRVLIGPALIIMADGTEVARLEGPRNRRSIDRFLSKVTPAIERGLVAA